MNETAQNLHAFLDLKYKQYNQIDFIANDPISIPHLFTKKQDIEIAGFIAAVLAWGQRVTIINKCKEFFKLMDNAPHDFILHHSSTDLKPFESFKHRTFNSTDALYFIEFFKMHYRKSESLEEAFLINNDVNWKAESSLIHFSHYFFSIEDHPRRTYKHIANPARKSACKRINMFLRWMVRKDDCGVDFGLWNQIKTKDLICPCDLHVDRVARKLGLITRRQTDWNTAIELTENLKRYDPIDPVKYDFALFGLGVEEKF
ncbi:MAG: TIGR02757 family protein [Cyclobacteriaceae bacterium]